MLSPAWESAWRARRPMLAVEHAQHPVLLGNLEQAQVVLAGDRVKVNRFSE